MLSMVLLSTLMTSLMACGGAGRWWCGWGVEGVVDGRGEHDKLHNNGGARETR